MAAPPPTPSITSRPLLPQGSQEPASNLSHQVPQASVGVGSPSYGGDRLEGGARASVAQVSPFFPCPGRSDVGANTLAEVPGASAWRSQPPRAGAAGGVPRAWPGGHCHRGWATWHPGTREWNVALSGPPGPPTEQGGDYGFGFVLFLTWSHERPQVPRLDLEGMLRAAGRAGLASMPAPNLAELLCPPAEPLPDRGLGLPGLGRGPPGGGLAPAWVSPYPAAPWKW